jgi:hypothetical protein
MKVLLQLLGLGAIALGLYLLAQVLWATTAINPYLWRGLTTGLSVLLLALGLLKLLLLPLKRIGYLGFFTTGLGVAMVVLSRQAIFNPALLLPFGLAIAAIVIGYRLMAIASLSV